MMRSLKHVSHRCYRGVMSWNIVSYGGFIGITGFFLLIFK